MGAQRFKTETSSSETTAPEMASVLSGGERAFSSAVESPLHRTARRVGGSFTCVTRSELNHSASSFGQRERSRATFFVGRSESDRRASDAAFSSAGSIDSATSPSASRRSSWASCGTGATASPRSSSSSSSGAFWNNVVRSSRCCTVSRHDETKPRRSFTCESAYESCSRSHFSSGPNHSSRWASSSSASRAFAAFTSFGPSFPEARRHWSTMNSPRGSSFSVSQSAYTRRGASSHGVFTIASKRAFFVMARETSTTPMIPLRPWRAVVRDDASARCVSALGALTWRRRRAGPRAAPR